MEEKGEAVTIYVRQDDGSYKLDEVALENILCQEAVAENPIMVLSVAGAMREGKSFLLNLIIKYLESGRNEHWLSNDSKLAGFHWQGGSERDTLGILMWSKPFHVEDENGEKVAVLLMDTQGAFDNEHTMGQSTRIFTMSLMMCSVQIYNVMQTLRADKLQFFALFLEHAKMVKDETKKTVFQSLMFLVRDWPHQIDHDFGSDGGTAYIKKQLKNFAKSKFEKKVLKDIFNQYEGFLLPYPGAKVAELRDGEKPFAGEASDMNEDFVKYIKWLAHHLFRKENIVKKEVTGEVANGRCLLNHAKIIARLYENKDMPEPKDLVEAQIEAHCSNILDEFTRKFREKLTESLPSEQFVDDETLDENGRRALDDTMQEFEKRKIYGGEEVKKDCKTKLDASLNHALEEAKVRNRDTRNKYRKKYEDFFTSESESMEKELSQNFDKRCVLDQEIEEACENLAEKMKKKLLEQKFGVESFDMEFVKKTDDFAVKMRNSLLRKNRSESEAAESASAAKEAELELLARDMLKKELERNLYSKSELKDLVERLKIQIRKKWKEDLSKYPDFVLTKFKESLEKKLDNLLDLADDQNKENQDKFSRDVSVELSELRKKYNEKMEKRIGKRSVDIEILEKFHQESFEETQSALQKKDLTEKLKQSCLDKIESALGKELKKLETRNEERTIAFETSCGLEKSKCVGIARERIKEACGEKVLSDDMINSIHAESVRAAKDIFRKQKELGSKVVYEKCEAGLDSELGKLLSDAKKTNKDVEKHFLLTKATEMKAAKKEYKKAMSQITGDSEPVAESELKAFHEDKLAETKRAFMAKLTHLPPDVVKECEDMLRSTLKLAFGDILRENHQKKKECELQVKQIVAECLEIYNVEMGEAGKGRIPEGGELESYHKQASKKAHEKLDVLKPGWSESMAGAMNENLNQSINDRHNYFKQDNERRKVWAEKEVGDRMEKFERMYKNEITQLTGRRSWSEEDLLRHHRTACEKVETRAQSIRPEEIRQLLLDEIDESASTWLIETKNANDAKQDEFEKKCEKAQQEAKDRYKIEMSRKGLFLTDDELRSNDKNAQASAIQHFCKSGLKGPEETISRFEQELKDDLNYECNIIEAENNDNRTEMDKKAKELVASAFKTYEQKMKMITANTAMRDEKLEEQSERVLEDINVSDPDLHRFYAERTKKEFQEKVEKKFQALKEMNQRLQREQDQNMRNYLENECVESYEMKMKELCGMEIIQANVNIHHPASVKCAFDKFESYERAWNREEKFRYRTILNAHCVESKKRFLIEGEQNEVKRQREIEALVLEVENAYRTHMEQNCSGRELQDRELYEMGTRAESKAAKIIDASTAGREIRQSARVAFSKAVARLFSEAKSRNNSVLLQAEAITSKRLADAEKCYEQAMNSYIRSNCCHDLQPKHNQVMAELQGQDSSFTGIDKNGEAYKGFKMNRDRSLATLFKQFERENCNIQAERKNQYRRVVGDVFGSYKTAALKQLKKSDDAKWIIKSRKANHFEEHYPDIKNEYISKLQRELPPSHSPSCTTCEGEFIRNLKSQMDDYKDSILAKWK